MPWFEEAGLPDEVKGWDEVTKAPDADTFWKQMSDMRSHIGQSIRVPPEGASEADIKAFHDKLSAKVPGLIKSPNFENEEDVKFLYKKMGWPESADQYTEPEIENKEKLDLGLLKAFKPVAHKYGLTQKQFAGIVADISQANVEGAIEQEGKHSAEMQTLRTDWGLKYDDNVGTIQALLKTTKAPDGLVEAVTSNRAAADVLIWLSNVATAIGSEGLNLPKGTPGPTKMTPAEAQNKISEILADRKSAYWDKGHPGHKAALQGMLELQAMAHPGASTSIEDLRANRTTA